jgi:hypothetical protein
MLNRDNGINFSFHLNENGKFILGINFYLKINWNEGVEIAGNIGRRTAGRRPRHCGTEMRAWGGREARAAPDKTGRESRRGSAGEDGREGRAP